jgi:uncharacterized Zn-binding protein involved in type VI secretion
MPPAARISDFHTCPLATPGTPPIPHVGGPIITGAPTVLIGFMPAARVSDMAICTGPPDTIAKGSMTVFIGSMCAARIGDNTAHGGVVVMGCPTVIIGDGAGPPMMAQEMTMSCGPASVRMVIASETGQNIPEADLRQQSQDYPGSFDPINGTNMSNLTQLLRANGVSNASDPQSGQTVDDLQRATADGHPAIAHHNNPGGGGHFVVVDGVRTNPDGSRTVLVRDPGPPNRGTRREMSEADFNNRGFSGWTITTNP